MCPRPAGLVPGGHFPSCSHSFPGASILQACPSRVLTACGARPSPKLTGARVGVRAPSRGSLCRRRGGGAGTALRPSLRAIDGAAGLSWLRPGSVHRGPTSSQAWEGDVSASSAAGSLCSRAGRAARVLLGCRLSNTSCSNVLQPPAFFLRFHRFPFTVKPSIYAALLREGVCSQAASCAPTVRVSRCLSFLSPRR